MAGWVRLYRKSTKSRVWANDGLWKTWCWCLMRANHNERIVSVRTGRGETEVAVKRGQFIYGRKAAAKALKCPESTCHKRMQKLAGLKNIVMQPNTHFTVVTICNFDRYNKTVAGNATGKGTTKEQPRNNQGNTDKNVSKESREKREGFCPPTLKEVADYCVENAISVQPQRFLDHYQASGWKRSRGLPVTDWRAVLRYFAGCEVGDNRKPNGAPSAADRAKDDAARRRAMAEQAARIAKVEATPVCREKLPPFDQVVKAKP